MRLSLSLALAVLLTALPALPAFADLTMKEVTSAYRQNGIQTRITSTPLDAAWIAGVRPRLGRDGKAPITALQTGLAGATLHVVSYRHRGFSANFIEHDGAVKLAFFYLPVFAPTGAAPPKGYLKVAQDLSQKMTDNTVSSAGFAAVLEASITEAHAYADKTSRAKYPGVVFRRGKTWQYSAQALVPDYLMLTVTRFPQCAFGYRKRGWMLQHICQKAR